MKPLLFLRYMRPAFLLETDGLSYIPGTNGDNSKTATRETAVVKSNEPAPLPRAIGCGQDLTALDIYGETEYTEKQTCGNLTVSNVRIRGRKHVDFNKGKIRVARHVAFGFA